MAPQAVALELRVQRFEAAGPAPRGGSGRARYRVDDPVDHLRRLAEIIARVGQAVDRRLVDPPRDVGIGREGLGERTALLVDHPAGVVDHVMRLLAADLSPLMKCLFSWG